MSKNKHLLSVLLIAVIGLLSFSAYSIGDDKSTQENKEIELIVEKSRPKKSLFIAPDIRAYTGNGMVRVEFNEAIAGNVTISIAGDHGTICQEVLQVISPMNWDFFVDLDEESYYSITIAGSDWIMTGEF